MSALKLFEPRVKTWFRTTLGDPTAVQEEAWPAIADGRHILVSAPTGTGKTLSAFLVFLNEMIQKAENGELPSTLQLIYISPLKSLANDIRENLKKPLEGILEMPIADDFLNSPLRIAIRTGDTPANLRQRMVRHPPHILITTPESLYLMLTSQSGRSILKTGQTIIIDELHALIDSKRGAHLMLSLARLDALCPEPLQRIGLSATIDPLSRAAAYLSPDPVVIAAPSMKKKIDIRITTPITSSSQQEKDMIWPALANTVYHFCSGSRSVIAFTESRMQSEKLAYYVNQLAGKGFASTHHGSMSKERRMETEQSLRDGNLRLLCATSSMELGIDVGEIDQVLQIGCPSSVASTLQRLGRAGHNPNRTSIMHILPRTVPESLNCGLTAQAVRSGYLESCHPPSYCLDVLAQHLVSMSVCQSLTVQEVMEILKRAQPFYKVTPDDVRDVLKMLSGDYEHANEIPVRPRLLYDRIQDSFEGDAYSRMLAVFAGGTIPDKGMYTVRTENGVKLGELDEEFIYESRIGDKFILGTFAWQIKRQTKDAIIVKPASMQGAKPPFWKGDGRGRSFQTGRKFGEIMRILKKSRENGYLEEALSKLGLDAPAAKNAAAFLGRQFAATGTLADDRTILVEHFADSNGMSQIMVHSVFGKQVNAPLSLLVQHEATRRTGQNIGCVDEENGFMLYAYGKKTLPEGILPGISPDSAEDILKAVLPSTPLFHMNFRYNAARALMMGTRNNARQPLWVQRMRSADMLGDILNFDDHPLIRETKRECLHDCWDIAGVKSVLNGIRAGTISLYEIHTDSPSPMSLPLQWQVEANMMYNYTPVPSGIHEKTAAELEKLDTVPPTREQLLLLEEHKKLPENEKQLHSFLMIEGDLTAHELPIPVELLENLVRSGKAAYIEPGLWIAAEHKEEYLSFLSEGKEEAGRHILRRMLRYRGSKSKEEIGNRYVLTGQVLAKFLELLLIHGEICEDDGIFYHAKLYERARKNTIQSRREEIQTSPPECYSALLLQRVKQTAPPEVQLEQSLSSLSGQSFSPSLWETSLLPVRVSSYRPELLDKLLAQGKYFYQVLPDKGLAFYPYEQIDWDANLPDYPNYLNEKEQKVYQLLIKRGACFMKMLSDALEGESVHDTLLDLVEKGYVHADSFLPIRQLIGRSKIKKTTARATAYARARALAEGRFDVVRPRKAQNPETVLNCAFEQTRLLCYETMKDWGKRVLASPAWNDCLEILRVMEYTGQVRRGYFIEGFSGAQFIRDRDFAGMMQRFHEFREELSIKKPDPDIFWISCADPAQIFGKSLSHKTTVSFLNIPGNYVAFSHGLPVAVLEKKGKELRVFDYTALPNTLLALKEDFLGKRLLPMQNRLLIRTFPEPAGEYFKKAGFLPEMNDYVLYR